MASMYNNMYNYLTSVNPSDVDDIISQAKYVINDHLLKSLFVPKFYYVAIERKRDGDLMMFLLRNITEYYVSTAPRGNKDKPLEVKWYIIKYPQRGQPIRMTPLAEQAVSVISVYETRLAGEYMEIINSL